MKNVLMVCSVPLFMWIVSCHRGASENTGFDTPEEENAKSPASEIILSKDQFESMGMEVGNPVPKLFRNSVSANGYVVSTPSGSANISTLIAGRIRYIAHSPGDQVEKGETLFSLEGNEIIELQQEYAEAFHQLKVLKADNDRLKALSEENVVAQKEFLKTESEYGSMSARTMGLKSRLEMVGIDPSSIERGELVPYLSVTSPIHGIIIRQQLVLGQYVEPQETVLEVIDHEKMQLELQVFENDLTDIAIGQQVLFYRPDNREKEFKAIISHIGKSIEPETRVVHCLARIDPGYQGAFMNNLFVETRIITCERQAPAIPEEALIREGETDNVLVLRVVEGDRMKFEKIPLHTGMTMQGYTEVLDEDVKDILIAGAYNLWSED